MWNTYIKNKEQFIDNVSALMARWRVKLKQFSVICLKTRLFLMLTRIFLSCVLSLLKFCILQSYLSMHISFYRQFNLPERIFLQ